MSKQKVEELVLEYMKNKITKKREKELEEILIKNGYSSKELKKMKVLYGQLDEIPIPEPDEAMSKNFYTLLEDQKENISVSKNPLHEIREWLRLFDHQKIALRFAYSFILLLAGWIVGYWFTPNSGYNEQLNYMSSEIQDMKTMMAVSMLNQESPTERIKTIHQFQYLDSDDATIITALLNTLNNDENVNVRLIAIEALVNLTDNIRVREGLISSISQQESPLVQLALAAVLVGLKEKTAVGQFKELLNKKDLNDSVRDRIKNNLKKLI